MEALWFSAVLLMLVMYAILDGFDLGSGVIHLFLTRSESDRRSVLTAAGPFWDGNEIWLLLAGGALYCAFPAVYASRRFYLAAIALLWMLILRGISMEFRSRIANPRWRRSLDVIFGVTSMLLTLSLGAAAGYLVRTVPPASGPAALNWLPLLSGLCALAVLTLQSAAWNALKSAGELQLRCRQLASRVWWAVLFFYTAVTAGAVIAQPHVLDNLLEHTWISAFAVLALAGLIGARLCLSVGFDLGVFASAACVIAGLLASTAAGQYPYLLNHELTVYNAGATPYGMSIDAIWWIPAFVLAAGYNVRMHRLFRSKLASAPTQPVATARG